jgi:hypothetical protein
MVLELDGTARSSFKLDLRYFLILGQENKKNCLSINFVS